MGVLLEPACELEPGRFFVRRQDDLDAVSLEHFGEAGEVGQQHKRAGLWRLFFFQPVKHHLWG